MNSLRRLPGNVPVPRFRRRAICYRIAVTAGVLIVVF